MLVSKFLQKEVVVHILGIDDVLVPYNCKITNYDEEFVEVRMLDANNKDETWLIPYSRCIIHGTI